MNKKTKLTIFALIAFFLISALFLVSFLLSTRNNQLNTNSNAASNSPILLSFDPNNITAAINTEFTLNFLAKSINNLPIQGFSITVIFDNTQYQVTDISYKLGNPANGLGSSNTTLSTVNTDGKISLFSQIESPDGALLTANSSTPIVSFKFKLLKIGSGQINIDSSKNNQFIKINSDSTLEAIGVTLQSSAGMSQTRTPATSTPVITSTQIHTTKPNTSVSPTPTSKPINTIKPSITSTPNSTTPDNTAIPTNTEYIANTTEPIITTTLSISETITETSTAPTSTNIVPTKNNTAGTTAHAIDWVIYILLGAIVVLLGAIGIISILKMINKKRI